MIVFLALALTGYKPLAAGNETRLIAAFSLLIARCGFETRNMTMPAAM